MDDINHFRSCLSPVEFRRSSFSNVFVLGFNAFVDGDRGRRVTVSPRGRLFRLWCELLGRSKVILVYFKTQART